MTALAPRDTATPAVAESDASSLMAVIDRAVRDQSVDVGKLERLLEMYKGLEARQAERAFNAAMTAAQKAVGPIAADSSNPQTKSKYASYLALDRVLRPIYTGHGFALSFDTGDAPDNMVRVLCYVTHDQGHSRTYAVNMPADGKGAKGGDVMTRTHATGSAITYGQRYLLKLIFNTAVGGDDDGNAAGRTNGNGGKITLAQAEEISRLCEETQTDAVRLCSDFLKVETVCDIPARDYDRAIRALKARGKRK